MSVEQIVRLIEIKPNVFQTRGVWVIVLCHLDLKSAISALFSGRNERFDLGNAIRTSKLTTVKSEPSHFAFTALQFCSMKFLKSLNKEN